MPLCCMTRLKPRAKLARSGCFGPSWSLTAQLYSARRPIASRHRRASKRRWAGGISRQTGTAASNGCMPLSWYWSTQQRFRCERRSRRRYHYADQYHSLESGNRVILESGGVEVFPGLLLILLLLAVIIAWSSKKHAFPAKHK